MQKNKTKKFFKKYDCVICLAIAILKYRGHAKVTEKVALYLAFMDQKIQ